MFFSRLRHVWLILCAGIVLGSTSLWSCRTQETDEIRIGLSAILSGPLAPGQKGTVEGAKLAVENINNVGGLNLNGKQHKVVLLIEDSEDKAETAVSTVLKLINQQNIVSIVGPNMSRNAIPVANMCENARIPMISTGSTNPETTKGKTYVFRASYVDDFQGKLLANFACRDLGIRKAAVLYDIASVYNRGLAEEFQEAFKEYGGEVVASESYTSDVNRDFGDQLQRISSARPELLFLPNYDRDVILQVQQARKIGLDAKFLGSDSWGQLRTDDLASEGFDGAFFSNSWSIEVASSAAELFVTDFRNTYRRDPTSLAALTYDAFGLLFHAIRQQGKADPESIRQGLSEIKRYEGVTGQISYSGSGDPVKSAVILQIKGGELRFYKTVDPF